MELDIQSAQELTGASPRKNLGQKSNYTTLAPKEYLFSTVRHVHGQNVSQFGKAFLKCSFSRRDPLWYEWPKDTTPMKNTLYALASLSMAIGVACGAFGAHGLRGTIPESDLLIWEKAVFYQLVHSLAVLVLLVTPATLCGERVTSRCAALFLLGTAIFSASLYILVLTNLRWLGAITPLGGTCFIAGWVLLGIGTVRRRIE